MTLLSLSLSNLGPVSLQWRFVQTGPYWTIKNVTNNQFANLQPGKPIAPGVQVATATPRNWELRFDKIWGGWR